jgi:HPP family
MTAKPDKVGRRFSMLARIVVQRGASQRPSLPGLIWMAVLLGILVWLNHLGRRIFLVPPFAATITILLYLPNLAIAQPYTVVFGSTCGAGIGTALTSLLGFGPDVAILSVHRCDRAAFAACLSSALYRFGDVSRSVASWAMVCNWSRTALHARRGDFLRGDEPVIEQVAAIFPLLRTLLRRIFWLGISGQQRTKSGSSGNRVGDVRRS